MDTKNSDPKKERYAVRVRTGENVSKYEVFANNVQQAMMRGQEIHYEQFGYGKEGEELHVEGLRLLEGESLDTTFEDAGLEGLDNYDG